MKKRFASLLSVIFVLVLAPALSAGCTAAAPSDATVSTAVFPNTGRNDAAYDIGKLDVINHVSGMAEARQSADTEPYQLGDVRRLLTAADNGEECRLAEVLYARAGQTQTDEYRWILIHPDTGDYTWLACNAELIAFTSPGEISFTTGYNPEDIYLSFPARITFVNTGDRWISYSGDVWLDVAESGEFGLLSQADPDAATQAIMAGNPYRLTAVVPTVSGLSLLTAGGEEGADKPLPYTRINPIAGAGHTMEIVLQDTVCEAAAIAALPDFCPVSAVTFEQIDGDTHITLTLTAQLITPTYRTTYGIGSWYGGNCISVDFSE